MLLLLPEGPWGSETVENNTLSALKTELSIHGARRVQLAGVLHRQQFDAAAPLALPSHSAAIKRTIQAGKHAAKVHRRDSGKAHHWERPPRGLPSTPASAAAWEPLRKTGGAICAMLGPGA